MIGVPIIEPKFPTFVTVYVPSEISSGLSELDLALPDKSLTANVRPFKFR